MLIQGEIAKNIACVFYVVFYVITILTDSVLPIHPIRYFNVTYSVFQCYPYMWGSNFLKTTIYGGIILTMVYHIFMLSISYLIPPYTGHWFKNTSQFEIVPPYMGV